MSVSGSLLDEEWDRGGACEPLEGQVVARQAMKHASRQKQLHIRSEGELDEANPLKGQQQTSPSVSCAMSATVSYTSGAQAGELAL